MADAIITQAPLGIPQENLPNLRAYVARTIENLVNFLDALDECCDLEDSDPLELEEDACEAGDDGNHVQGQSTCGPGCTDDAEDGYDAEAINEDGEDNYGADDQWFKIAKDKRRIEAVKQRLDMRTARKVHKRESRAVKTFIGRAQEVAQ